ncbi:HAD family hydrolase [Fonticella tunisiensis]|uniref:Cof subfamily protein (Haloacid dehalogenase superfamily)/HAD superfamily hydrolase (TIGR01484 family) n=1 Tax=Fonticella tunisiensis TaxID=1096341 RepID=A0A4R7K9Z5_9CLOT|nr:HAD-IIB family hydrolase [Fonticella tunisiensis]TDT51068.1 hypothetical protein EDD71_12238 [Fonticella tunisiensis]
MRKLFATDLDGTLIKRKLMPYNNYRYLKKLSKMKHCLAVATGRAYNEVGFLKRIYNINVDYYVLLNGALIMDNKNNVLKHESIPFETVERIIKENCNRNWKVVFETGFTTIELSNNGQRSRRRGRKIVGDIKDVKNDKISLISLYYEEDNIKFVDEVCENINRKYGDKVAAYRNVRYIDVVPAGCSKGSGIKYVKKKESILHENTFAIGDSWNDVSMFKAVYHSFTLKNAEKELHKKAKYVVGSVGECIKEYVLSSDLS